MTDDDPNDRNLHIRKLLQALEQAVTELGLQVAADPVVMFDRSGNGADIMQCVFAIDWSTINGAADIDEATAAASATDTTFEEMLGGDDEIMASLARVAQEDELAAARQKAIDRKRRLTGEDEGGDPPVTT